MTPRTNPKTFAHAHKLRQNQTEAEARLWQVLRNHRLGGVHFRCQHAIDHYVVDFCAPRLKIIVEIDGEHHMEQQEYDHERTAFLESKGYRVPRFWNQEVLKGVDGVLRLILEAINQGENRV